MTELNKKKSKCFSDITNSEAVNKLKNSIGSHTIVLSGYCSVDYEGRASSYFDYSDVLVIVKPDGTLLIHQNEGREPVNWQPPGCSFTVSRREDELYIKATRKNEKIEINCAEVYSFTVNDISNTKDKELFGTEKQMQTVIMENPSVIEDGFKPVEKEKSIQTGAIDIFGEDKNGVPTILELKRRRAGPDAVDQLKRYVTSFIESSQDTDIRGILVAPSFTETVSKMLEKENLESKKLEPPSNSDRKNETQDTLDEFH